MVSEHRARKLVLGVLVGAGCIAVLIGVTVAVVLPALLVGGLSEDRAAESGRTVLLIAVDDLRRDALAFQGEGGDDLDPTPVLSRLAKGGSFARDYVPASTATGPSLGALFTGLGPDETGFASQRTLGAHRLPRAAETLAERFSADGWSTVAAFALPQDDGRLSGLGQGFDDVLSVSSDGPPLAAPTIATGLVDLVRQAAGDVFAFAHLADLRADWEPPLDAARVALLLERRLAPLRASDPELARRLDEPAPNADGSKADVIERIDRRRGSPEWLVLQQARYDARLEALDAALGDLLDGLADLGRDAPLVVVAGTRGRLLGVEPPGGGPPIELSEALLRTAFVVAPGELRGNIGDADWARIDRAARVAPAVLAAALGADLPEVNEAFPPRTVFGPSGAYALLRAELKEVFAPRAHGLFDRADDEPVSFGEVEPAALPNVLVVQPRWRLRLAPPAGRELDLSVSSGEGSITALQDGKTNLASPSGRSARLVATGEISANLMCAGRQDALTLTLTGLDGPVAIGEQGPGDRGASKPLVSALVPILPPRPGEPDGGGEAAAPLQLEADGAWTRVRVRGSAGAEVELALWLTPRGDGARALEVEPTSDGRIETFPGLDAARVRGVLPLDLRVRRGSGQSVAVSCAIAGRPLRPDEMTSDRGGAPSELALYLPPVDLGVVSVTSGGAEAFRADAAELGLPLEPPYALTEKDARLLLRLGPLE